MSIDLSQQAAMDAAYGEAVCRTRRQPQRKTFEDLARRRGWDSDAFAQWSRGRLWAT